jgi:hypothetical protein
MATRDPLEQFRRSGQAQTPPTAQPTTAQPLKPPASVADEELDSPPKFDPRTGREVYEPYHIATTRRVEHLEIRPALTSWEMPRYFDMSNISVNQHLGTEIVLQFPLYAVFIAGRNLQALAYALKWHRCHMIQEYHPQKFAPLMEDEHAPFIQSIHLRMKVQQPEENQPA